MIFNHTFCRFSELSSKWIMRLLCFLFSVSHYTFNFFRRKRPKKGRSRPGLFVRGDRQHGRSAHGAQSIAVHCNYVCSAMTHHYFRGSFSSVSTPIFASKSQKKIFFSERNFAKVAIFCKFSYIFAKSIKI